MYRYRRRMIRSLPKMRFRKWKMICILLVMVIFMSISVNLFGNPFLALPRTRLQQNNVAGLSPFYGSPMAMITGFPSLKLDKKSTTVVNTTKHLLKSVSKLRNYTLNATRKIGDIKVNKLHVRPAYVDKNQSVVNPVSKTNNSNLYAKKKDIGIEKHKLKPAKTNRTVGLDKHTSLTKGKESSVKQKNDAVNPVSQTNNSNLYAKKKDIGIEKHKLKPAKTNRTVGLDKHSSLTKGKKSIVKQKNDKVNLINVARQIQDMNARHNNKETVLEIKKMDELAYAILPGDVVQAARRKLVHPPAKTIDNHLAVRQAQSKTFCTKNKLVGRTPIYLNILVDRLNFDNHTDLKPGGQWSPTSCIPNQKVAIIIPYRNRRKHLYLLLFYLIPLLKRQQVEFRIFVVEQAGNGIFNKGIIMNAGFKEAVRLSGYHCYIFHDVDLIPEDDRNMYSCPQHPRHLSVAVDKFKYRLPYAGLVGGVLAFRREDFETVNGYSNLYWGWGAEDDDMFIRLSVAKKRLSRPSATTGRYKMLKHSLREKAPRKWITYLLNTVRKRFHIDGLNTVNYNVTSITLEPLITHIMVDVGEPPKMVKDISAIIT